MASMAERLDIIIFGATGFTGKYTVQEMDKLSHEKSLTWGIAGRNKSKMDSLLKKLGTELGKDFSKIETIVADVSDEESLKLMGARARVVINCCGPYRHWGEQVVKACIDSGAHHVDVSGEPQYMERMQLEYHEAAQKKGVFVVSACGFDSIPADLGLVFLQKSFPGELNSVEVYLQTWRKGPNTTGGASLHYGTWESAVYGLAHADELRPLREKLFPTRMPKMLPTLKPRGPLFKSDFVNKWCMPFPGADRSVMQRSQRFFYENDKKRPAQIQTYVAFPSLIATFLVSVFGALFILLAKFNFGRKLLLRHPKLFSGGAASHEGPSEETMKNTWFSHTLLGQGWEEKSDVHDTPPNKKVIAKVTGHNPGYGATCTALVLSAITVLKESDKMPNGGGVYPPGAAFAKTSLIDELNKHELTFEMLE